jgi:TrmH family RNA methyltransferase
VSIERITSRQNPVVKQFRAAARGDDERVLLDGEHLIGEALTSDVAVEVAAVGDRLSAAPIVSRLERAGTRLLRVSDAVLSAISPVRTPSGIVAIARRSADGIERALAPPGALVLMLHDVQDPGNVGAAVRAAEACGATGVVCGDGTANPFGWKALRGSMGSSLRVPIAMGVPLVEAIARARGGASLPPSHETEHPCPNAISAPLPRFSWAAKAPVYPRRLPTPPTCG